MRDKSLLFWGLIAGVVLMTAGTATVLVLGWKRAKNAERYLPLLNAAEKKYGLPHDLLARMAYQESRFRDDIVSGAKKSAIGALGILQIVPKWHPTAQPLNVPAAIDYAGSYVSQLYRQFRSWPLAVAAYNAGPGNVKKYGGVPPFEETRTYVKEIFGDLLAAVPASERSYYA